MKKLQNFKASALTQDQSKNIKGGRVTTLKEYCNTLTMIMRDAFNRGDTNTMGLAGDAWDTHCK